MNAGSIESGAPATFGREQSTALNQATDLGRDEFMRLLLTQLRNQNPLEPISNAEFIGQLAQFSTLDAVEQLRDASSQSFLSQEVIQGASLIGKVVEHGTGTTVEGRGIVGAVSVVNGQVKLQVNEEQVPLSQVQRIFELPETLR